MEHDTNLKVFAAHLQETQQKVLSTSIVVYKISRFLTSCAGAPKTVNPISAAEANLQAMIRKAISEGRPMEEWTA